MIFLSGNGINLELPSPNWGNSIELPLRVKAHRAMSGERYTYITTPVKGVHNLSFSYLNNNQVEQVYAFIVANVGKYIDYVEDYPEDTEKIHKARILDGAVDFVHRAVRNNEFSLSLEVGDYA